MSLLKNVNSPDDIKNLSEKELNELCSEIRKKLINTVSKTGGHLASNLGMVELTVALHKVFNSPIDEIVFDVGHQCYTHKILTGRNEKFSTIRCENGISGFTRPVENENDIFSSGHASTSISSAVGLAAAKQIRGDKGKVIAVIGDGALTGGLAYEGLNNTNGIKNLIIIYNDNNMSISENVGSLAKNLTKVRVSSGYNVSKNAVRKVFGSTVFGNKLLKAFNKMNADIRKCIYKNTFFEDLGLRYYGPIDGHNIDDLVDVLNVAKGCKHSVLIHVNTVKGKGYSHAEENPTMFHGIGKFNIETGEPCVHGETFSSKFGDAMVDFASKDQRICCVTAAMAEGTGLKKFSEKYPDRFFDVGIAEEHAVTFCGGLAKNGMVPVFAVYSTFLQRSLDQVIHDVAMQDLKVIFAIDRAGFVGEDGESHQGVFDTSFLYSVPNFSIYCPSTFEELEHDFYRAIYKEKNACAIRYPRGNECDLPSDYKRKDTDFQFYGDCSKDVCIVTYGRLFENCVKASNILKNTFVLKLNKIKPIDEKCFDKLKDVKKIYFYEEAICEGGVGDHFASLLLQNGIHSEFVYKAISSEFVKQAPVDHQISHYGLDVNSIVKEVQNG